jgi:Anti-anti-sigma regulatory factor (antagonist of anti-sigma factor)
MVDRIPILALGDVLLVSIQVDLEDKLALRLQEDLSDQIVGTGARGVVIDISALDIVDSFIGRMLSTVASISRVLDAETVVVGMRPAVAITLVELGLSLKGVRTALNVEHGLGLLRGVRTAELLGLAPDESDEPQPAEEPAAAS